MGWTKSQSGRWYLCGTCGGRRSATELERPINDKDREARRKAGRPSFTHNNAQLLAEEKELAQPSETVRIEGQDRTIK